MIQLSMNVWNMQNQQEDLTEEKNINRTAIKPFPQVDKKLKLEYKGRNTEQMQYQNIGIQIKERYTAYNSNRALNGDKEIALRPLCINERQHEKVF